MEQNQNSGAPQQPLPPGWVGGWSGSNPAFAYPNPDLSSLPMPDNMANINRLTRMLKADWPEFSWETNPGHADSKRLFEMFAPDISRLGYDDSGRVWSIICPQQGVYFPTLGITLNIEVTVTGNRGWINELAPNRGESDQSANNNELFAADIKVKPALWFSPDHADGLFWLALQFFNTHFGSNKLPLSKAAGIRISTTNGTPIPAGYAPSDAIAVRIGQHPGIPFPPRAIHWNDGAWAVANLAVMMGSVESTGVPHVDHFNSLVMDLFNLGSGNLLQTNNVLTWNLWAGAPELVNQTEWQNHAAQWRQSIDVNHRPPNGTVTSAADFNGTPFHPDENAIGNAIGNLKNYLKSFFPVWFIMP